MTPRWHRLLVAAILGTQLALPVVASTDSPPPELPLRRAIFEWASDDTLAALLELEELNPIAVEAALAERGKILLAHLYRDSGDARFVELCAKGLSLTESSLHQHLAQLWLREALQAGAASNLSPVVSGELALLSAAVSLDREDPVGALQQLQQAPSSSLSHYLRACALELSGEDASAALDAALRDADPSIADGAGIWRASLAAAQGVDPTPWLRDVDLEGAYAQRAAHMLALWKFESNEEPVARAALESLLQEDAYAGMRDVQQMLAALALERAAPADALAYYLDASATWQAEDDSLLALANSPTPQRALDIAPPQLRLDEVGLERNDRAVLLSLRDLRQKLPDDDDVTLPYASTAPPRQTSLSLDRNTRDQLRAIERDLRAALADERRNERLAAEEERLLASLLRHRERGLFRLNASLPSFLDGAAELDSIANVLDRVLAQLRGVRDAELARIAQRTAAMQERARRHARRLRLIDQLFVQGPMRRLDKGLDEETPKPAELLKRDDALADSLESFVARFSIQMPELIARSSDLIWEPRLIGDAPQLRDRAHALAARSRLLSAAIDSARIADGESAALLAARAAAAEARARGKRLAAHHDSLLVDGARVAIARVRERLAKEREGIDYGLAASSYELAADLADSGAANEAIIIHRRGGIAYLQNFLARYPESQARGETRFRLADLVLSDSRDQFHERMQQYLETKNGEVPQLDYSPALTLYRQILDEDLSYSHRDAARFHLGMILADLGDPEAASQLRSLLDEFGESEFAQSAHLRLGDIAFDAEDFANASDHYESSASGSDRDVAAIALYKLGWSQFNSDSYVEAADAFRRLLDQYEAGFSSQQEIDLRRESEDDLVHALARAGGAKNFQRYFQSIGGRDYEPRLLASMSRLMRRYALYPESIETDELYLQRFSTRPGALEAAKRLLDSHGNHSGSEMMASVQMDLADRFRPDGEWALAQNDSTVIADASTFSRKGIRAAAFRAHKNAKDEGTGSWSLALGHYQTLLALWPDDGEAPRFSLLAGECALQLNDYEEALAQFTAAAASDTATFRDDAAWLRVVSCERWYDGSRETREEAGEVQLAQQLLDVGEAYLTAHPATDRAVELRWRDGNLRFLHGWYADAATSLGSFVEHHPTDTRAFDAAKLQGESLYRLEQFDLAADAYMAALTLSAAPDSTDLATLVPHCRYRHAEQVAGADSSGSAEAAPLFSRVAREWPSFEHSPRALYRAGSGYAAGGETATAVAQWSSLVKTHPKHELAPDAQRQIAQSWQEAGETTAAAAAYEKFSELYPDESDAADALMIAAELNGKAGDSAGQRRLENRYLDRYPGDVETAFALRESRAIAELDGLGTLSISGLLGAATGGELANYLALAKSHPDAASAGILARVAFLKAEEVRTDYQRLRLTQPLDASLKRKQASLEKLLAGYGNCVEQAIRPWAQASAHRIGEALVNFGDALMNADAPSELSGDDLLAYREVLEEQSWQFFDRGEEAWSRLLRDSGEVDDDIAPWLDRTRAELYPRIAERFLHRPEAVLPRIPATPSTGTAR